MRKGSGKKKGKYGTCPRVIGYRGSYMVGRDLYHWYDIASHGFEGPRCPLSVRAIGDQSERMSMGSCQSSITLTDAHCTSHTSDCLL